MSHVNAFFDKCRTPTSKLNRFPQKADAYENSWQLEFYISNITRTIDTHTPFQSFPPLVNHIIQLTVLAFSSCLNSQQAAAAVRQHPGLVLNTHAAASRPQCGISPYLCQATCQIWRTAFFTVHKLNLCHNVLSNATDRWQQLPCRVGHGAGRPAGPVGSGRLTSL